MNDFNDDEIYAIPYDRFRYHECVYCLCRMCYNMNWYCKNCFMCEYTFHVMRGCRWFVPFVFGKEPYKSYFRELEKLRGMEYDIIGRFE